jgi:hypothetical protein
VFHRFATLTETGGLLHRGDRSLGTLGEEAVAIGAAAPRAAVTSGVDKHRERSKPLISTNNDHLVHTVGPRMWGGGLVQHRPGRAVLRVGAGPADGGGRGWPACRPRPGVGTLVGAAAGRSGGGVP